MREGVIRADAMMELLALASQPRRNALKRVRETRIKRIVEETGI